MHEVVKIREKRPRGYGALISLIIAAFLIIYGTAISWIEFEYTGVEWDLHDYDDFNDSYYGVILVLLGILLIIIAVISLLPSLFLPKTFIILRVSAIILSVVAFFVTMAALADISDTLPEGIWIGQGGMGVTFFGSILAVISSAFLRGPQEIEAIIERPVEKPATTPPTTPPETKEPSVSKEAVKGQVICNNCGKSISKPSTFCPYCGTSLHENSTS